MEVEAPTLNEVTVIRALSALAQPIRLRAFRALVVAGSEGSTPGVLSDLLTLPPSGLSFHLKELANAGLVTVEQRGRHLVYRAHLDRMLSVMGYLTEHCCQGQDCGVDAAADPCRTR